MIDKNVPAEEILKKLPYNRVSGLDALLADKNADFSCLLQIGGRDEVVSLSYALSYLQEHTIRKINSELGEKVCQHKNSHFRTH